MLKKIDQLINSITMYRLVLYSLLALVANSLVASLLGLLPYEPLAILWSLLLLGGLSQFFNRFLAKIFRCPVNAESALISSLILFFLFAPANNWSGLVTLILASLIAMASKFVLNHKQAHLFNPAAVAAVLVPLLGYEAARWWVATPFLLPLTALVGALVIYKTKRGSLVAAFIFTAALSILYTNWKFMESVAAFGSELLFSWPLVFFASIMLTEPLTMPPTKKLQIAYGSLIGLLFGLPFHFGQFYSSPELALIIGNLFAFLVSGKKTLVLTLLRKDQLANNIYEFNFQSREPLRFRPGQYLEWTLTPRAADSRGNRRFFTIASSPTEQDLKVVVKVPDQASSFKQELLKLEPTNQLFASQLAGDFVLPKDPGEKIVMIAGGIGITPFRSQIKYLVDKQERRDVVLIYSASRWQELVYQDLWREAEQKIGLRTILLCSNNQNLPANWQVQTGRVTAALVKKEIPDWRERTFYLSGPSALVNNYKQLLEKMAVKKIVTDYFPGF
jgi:glycine betaine catabolism B